MESTNISVEESKPGQGSEARLTVKNNGCRSRIGNLSLDVESYRILLGHFYCYEHG